MPLYHGWTDFQRQYQPMQGRPRLDILCKQYSRARKTVIAVDVLECGVLGPECFCILKIILFAGLRADNSTASSQPTCY
jgi:hypothetical protein